MWAPVNYTRFSNVNLPAGVDIDRNSWGGALQVGVDIPLSKNLYLNFDVKKVYIKTDVFAGGAKAGTFKVTETVKSGPLAIFTVTAHAADLKKTLKKQKTRSWKSPKTMGDVVRDVAKDNGYEPQISEKLASVKIDKPI